MSHIQVKIVQSADNKYVIMYIITSHTDVGQELPQSYSRTCGSHDTTMTSVCWKDRGKWLKYSDLPPYQ